MGKLKKLKNEKEAAEKKGKSLSNKKITRIIRVKYFNFFFFNNSFRMKVNSRTQKHLILSH